MRVAHFVQRYPPAVGGAEAYFARLSRYLAQAGDEVTVFTTTSLDLENFYSPHGREAAPGQSRDDGVEVRRFGLLRLPLQRYVVKLLSFVPNRRWQALAMPWNPLAWSMWQAVGREQANFDLVHATAFPYGWPLACAYRLARRLRIPFLLTPFVHLGDLDDPDSKIRRVYLSPPLLRFAELADRVFVQTEGERQALLTKGIPANRLILQGMGVDLPSCTGGCRDEFRDRLGVPADTVLIGHLANASYEKGTIDLLQAADQAWANGGTFQLVLAGPEMPKFREFWEGYQARGIIHRLGILDDQKKRDFFAALDIFALPSRSDSFGIVLLEAWANGVPNLVYRAGGLPYVVRDGEDGLVVKCGDLTALANALLRLERDDALRRRLGETGLGRIGEFKWENKLELVRRQYGEVVG